MITTIGLSGVNMILGGYGSIPGYIAIGSGSGVVNINNTGLVYESDRNAITGSPDTSILQSTTYVGDFNSVELSGTSLKEFGLFNTASGGTLWVREGFTAIVFNGANELNINITISTF